MLRSKSVISRFHVPVLEPEDVVRHLGKQERHWKQGRSAHALAYVWQGPGFPPAVDQVLKTLSVFKSAQLIDAFLERQTDLGTPGRPSQTDLLAIVGLNNGLSVIAVEGKAGESFGKHVRQWRDGSPNKEKRLEGLCALLGLSCDAVMPLRYQLLHRAASALLESKRYQAKNAVLLVHSFSDDQDGFQDFSTFLQALGFEKPKPGELTGPMKVGGIPLFAGWVEDRPPDADKPSEYLDKLNDYASRRAKECKRVSEWCKKRRSK
jgi:hypothetical protein